MSNFECVSCRRPKAAFQCGVCDSDICKSCLVFLEESSFSFFTQVPAELGHSRYCAGCWTAHVEPAQERYQEVMNRARDAYFFFTTQRAQIPVLAKATTKVEIKSCTDRDESVLRLAFLAAEQGHNAVLEAEVVSTKVRDEGYQKTIWKAKGLPVTVDVERIERRSRQH